MTTAMNVVLIKAVLLAWVPIVAILFRVIGPRRAVLVGVIGGALFLPTGQFPVGTSGFAFPLNRWNVMGLSLILGVLIFDRRSLFRFRPSWLDLPMVLYAFAPLVGLITGVPGSSEDVVDSTIVRGLGWLIPYFMGRLYFGQSDGPTRVSIALMISGIVYIPFCLYEELAGPSRYLAGLIYQIPCRPWMVDRLGGWRPEVFMGDGISVASWMGLTTVIATWLWLGGSWRHRWIPAWLPPLALLATTLSCRGIYGYLIMAIGLMTVLLTWATRSRVVLVALATIPFTYMAIRASGLWDGRLLVTAAGFTGRAGTIAYRLQAEDEVIRKVLAYNPAFGFGKYVWHGGLDHWPDGSWLQSLWTGGLVDLFLFLTALYVLPASLGLCDPARRPSRRQASSATWALAAWCILQMIDGIHNLGYFNPLALIGGTLVGTFLSRNAVAMKGSSIPPDPPINLGKVPPTFVVAVIVWLAIEALGNLPRTPVAPKPEPIAPSVLAQ